MTVGALIRAAEQVEYSHLPHERCFLRDIVTSLENPGMSVHRGRIEVGGEIFPHLTEQRVETLYILSGTANWTLGEQQRTVTSGSCCVAPAGTRHGLRNSGEEPVELLVLFNPPLT